MTNPDELEKCPFCGGDFYFHEIEETGIEVRHNSIGDCPIEPLVGWYFTKEVALKTLNVRPAEASLRAQLAEAQAESAGFRSMMKSEVFDGLSTEQLIFIIHSMQDERAAKCLEYETTIEKLKNDAEFWFQQNAQNKVDLDKQLSEANRCNHNQALIIAALWEKHPEDAPSDEEDSGSYDSLIPDEYKSKSENNDKSWIDEAALTIKHIKENRANVDRLYP